MYVADAVVQSSTNDFATSKSRSFVMSPRMNAVMYLSICKEL